MNSWLSKIRSWFSPSDNKKSTCKAYWLQPSETGFDVPVLDLGAVTGDLLSTSQDPDLAERSISWDRSVGDELSGSSLAGCPETSCSLDYPAHPLLPDGVLFAPSCMEEKWVLVLQGEEILAARSWTGEVMASAVVRKTGERIHLDHIKFMNRSGFDVYGDPVQCFDWLIRTHALDQLLPLPVNEGGAEMLENVPLSIFGLFGKRAVYAACSWNPSEPGVPLRVYGRVIQAVRSRDYQKVQELLSTRESPNTPCPNLGFTPLGVAVVFGDLKMVKLLLEFGSDPNACDDKGLFPLGQAIVHQPDLEVMSALVNAGAHIHAVNQDGFGVLHAAAETNRGELVSWLLDRGVELESRTRAGHTALQIACALGNLDVAQALLDAGADLDADSPNGNAREIAEREKQWKAVSLLTRYVR